MTSNRDRALTLLNDLAVRMEDDAVSTFEAVQKLHDAGLLAEDLPEPTGAFPYWKVPTEDGEHDALIHLVGKAIVFRLEDGTPNAYVFTRDEARGVARALYAAAEHAETEDPDE